MNYRILSLDGGGAWALIEVRALIALYGENVQGHDVLRDFDLVTANSGGSLVLAGLVENLTLGGILALFQDEANRRAIFSPTTLIGDVALRSLTGLGPKYSAAAKLPAIERLLPKTGATKLTDAIADLRGPAGERIRLLITGFDYDRKGAAFFRSVPAGNAAFGNGVTTTLSLAACVHASTNAPVNYFDGPATVPGCPDRYWDGGLTGNNNPSLVGCIEALTLGQDSRDLRILSLGTATVRLPLAETEGDPGPLFAKRPAPSVVTDLTRLATTILDDPPDFATYAAYVITGGPHGLAPNVGTRIVRMNPLISPVAAGNGWTLPAGWTAEQFRHLCQIDLDAIDQDDILYIDDWCALWLAGGARNQPIRMDGRTLATEVGPDSWEAARATWQSFSRALGNHAVAA